jgi:lipoprotein-anchoring transpeptidase ErfK/SrfK
LNDIGGTYIEVDMTMQKLYGYKDGEKVIETDIVTGNMRRNWDTPAGVNYVYAKQKKRILRGANYATPVDYWMPVVGNIGLHDANWRSEFGGEIYQTDGSHGCVNIPPEVMPIIYETYEVGTPVIMFY